MEKLVTIFFCLSIVLINPWGANKGLIWTQPKILLLELIVILNLFIISQNIKLIKFTPNWKFISLLWGLFLFTGLLSTINSPFPMRSLFGQDVMRDGWLYWALVGTFTLTNSLIINIYPKLARSQFVGLLIGGVILAISTIPQVINWKLDYTITSGSLIDGHILQSYISRMQQPIGLYSHRGHSSLVLTITSLLVLFGLNHRWLSVKQGIVSLGLMIPALLLCQTRAALLALIVSGIYYFVQNGKLKNYKIQIISATLILFFLVLGISSTRHIGGLEKYNLSQRDIVTKQLTSDRSWLWELAGRGINQKPWLGWGFDGFGVAFPHALHKKSVVRIISLDNYSYTYQDQKGEIHFRRLPTTKAHNLVLDTAVSLGTIGAAVYFGMFFFCITQVFNSPYKGIEVIAIAYLVFGFTWFDCGQFTHLLWWGLSFFINEKVSRRAYISNTH